ncbi:hypothetical protein CTAYLR_010697 [Chrysophaeum taylorii]|uniref:Ankyrin repeat protein n=1 Tax=Chrysophaeum taylorii TaxID=2483200 RepID=A0AAD7UAH0_9STRA|nr:hypothetical protein CTAYLR_010697 [Chrysophaeum taylorii]
MKRKLETVARSALHVLVGMDAVVLLNCVDEVTQGREAQRGAVHAMIENDEWLLGILDGVSNDALAALSNRHASRHEHLVEISKLFDKVGVRRHIRSLLEIMIPGVEYDPVIDDNIQLPSGVRQSRNTKGVIEAFKEFVELGAINWVAWMVQKNGTFLRSRACKIAAREGTLEVLKWARANECPWDEDVCEEAARGGHLDVLKWARVNGCPWNAAVCTAAARGGHIEVLKWARANECPWNEWTFADAAFYGHLNVLTWARAHGCPWNQETCSQAARAGHLDVLKWARANGCPWDSGTCSWAAFGGHLDVLKWARAHGCPWFDSICADSDHADVREWVRAHCDHHH